MRGLDNNEEAKNLVKNFKGSTENRMRSLYNLGYWQGFNDGQREAVQMLERTLMDMTVADHETEPMPEPAEECIACVYRENCVVGGDECKGCCKKRKDEPYERSE